MKRRTQTNSTETFAPDLGLRVIEVPIALDQSMLYAFHSFLLQVEANAGYICVAHA